MAKTDQSKPTQPNDDDKRRAFLAEYQALCNKFGIMHAAAPAFVGRDDGTYSIIIQWQVTPLPKEKQEA